MTLGRVLTKIYMRAESNPHSCPDVILACSPTSGDVQITLEVLSKTPIGNLLQSCTSELGSKFWIHEAKRAATTRLCCRQAVVTESSPSTKRYAHAGTAMVHVVTACTLKQPFPNSLETRHCSSRDETESSRVYPSALSCKSARVSCINPALRFV